MKRWEKEKEEDLWLARGIHSVYSSRRKGRILDRLALHPR